MFKIAITGKANTGKNTLAKLIDEQVFAQTHPDPRRVTYKGAFMAFADPIKEIVMTMFPQSKKDCLYGPSALRSEPIPDAFKHGLPLSYRQALIDIGTLARAYNDLVWIENFEARYNKIATKNPQLIIVTDVRFRNEFNYLKEQGFFQIRLYRETGMPAIDHASETNQNTIRDDEFDCVVSNNRTLDYLKDEVKKIIPRLKS